MKGLFLFAVLFSSVKLMATDIIVSSVEALQVAINKAQPGDVIKLKDGVYATTGEITIKSQGTAKQPITIAAEHTGAAEIAGSHGFNIVSPATYIVITGFNFTHAASKAKCGAGTSFCRWTRNIFETPGEGENLTIAGSDHEVDYNTFRNKKAMGRFLAIRGSGSQIAERPWIHHNYFKSHTDQGGKNGAEAFQFGLSGFSLSSSNSIVEYNLFEDCAGENELISIKASAITLRYNTIRNCPAQFTLRHGNKCQVYGNYFINTPGIRFFGDDHVIHSNYFENCNPAIQIGNGGAEVADGAPLTSHDRPDRVLVAFNTLINNKSNIIQSARKDGLGSTFITIAANIIQGGGPAAIISGPFRDSVWEENIIFDTKEAGDMPGKSYSVTDPRLTRDASGVWRLSKASPAIDKIKTKYPAVTCDMDGQPRTALPDAGADEFSSSYPRRLLLPADVGHGAGR